MKTRRRSIWIRLAGGIVYALWCTLALGVGTAMGWIGQSQVLSHVVMDELTRTPPEVVFQNHETLTVLILGCDEDRAPGGKRILRKNARSDMMLVARVDFPARRISGLSIPRDLVVDLPGYSPMKVNAYHAIGGKDLAKDAAEFVLGVPIDRVIVLNYEKFQEMVDMLGGVEMFIPKPLNYDDRRGGLHIHLKPGRQKLNGYDAMCFVRYRHGDSDFARQDRQKDFLLAFKDTVLAKKELLPKVIQGTKEVAGGEFSDREIAALIRFARSVSGDNIKIGMLPVVESSGYNLAIDRSKFTQALRDHYFLGSDRSAMRVGQ